LRSEDTPLGRTNFLKGQAINGPFGVVARLARRLGIVDEDDRLGRSGQELLLAWSDDENLPGILDEGDGGSAGKLWLDRFVQATAAHTAEGQWKSQGWSGWQELADRLRPDRIGRRERRVLRQLLDRDPIRARCLELLSAQKALSTYRAASEAGRSEQDRRVLLEAVLPALSVTDRTEDRVIELTVRLADAYERVAGLLETAFNGLLWGLTRRGGQATPVEIEADKHLQPIFRAICRQLSGAAQTLRGLIEKIPAVPQVSDVNPIEPLDAIAFQAQTGAESSARLIETVIARHRDIQKSKGKGMWIEPGDKWTLMPGFGQASDGPAKPEVAYLHTFRVPNAYSFLGELGLSGVEVPDGEA